MSMDGTNALDVANDSPSDAVRGRFNSMSPSASGATSWTQVRAPTSRAGDHAKVKSARPASATAHLASTGRTTPRAVVPATSTYAALTPASSAVHQKLGDT